MTLGELIARLEREQNKDRIIGAGFSNPHSYRGYYECLAFVPTPSVTVASMLDCAREAVGETYYGWKGGDYTMSEWTDVYLAQKGDCCGEELTKATLEAMLSTMPEENDALRKRVEELEGEARVLIGCPCLCHTGECGEPHRDCRECVRGCTTPSAIDHDHEWALWCEKWRAQVEVTARTYSKLTDAEGRAEKAERERDEAIDERDVLMEAHQALGHEYEMQGRALDDYRAKAIQRQQDFDGAAHGCDVLQGNLDALQADLDAALTLCVAADWDVKVLGAGYEPEVYKAHAHVLALLEKRREENRG